MRIRSYILASVACLAAYGTFTQAATSRNAIPQAFQGKWGESQKTCDDPNEDPTGFSVSAFEMSTYDGSAYVTSVSVVNASEILVTADWNGEGKQWQETDRLKLTKSGVVLKFERVGKAGRGASFAVVRCA